MKRCENICEGWERSGDKHFGENIMGYFSLINYGQSPGNHRPVAGYSNDSVSHCPWCGARLVEEKKKSALEGLSKEMKYGNPATMQNETLEVIYDVFQEIKERLEVVEAKHE